MYAPEEFSRHLVDFLASRTRSPGCIVTYLSDHIRQWNWCPDKPDPEVCEHNIHGIRLSFPDGTIWQTGIDKLTLKHLEARLASGFDWQPVVSDDGTCPYIPPEPHTSEAGILLRTASSCGFNELNLHARHRRRIQIIASPEGAIHTCDNTVEGMGLEYSYGMHRCTWLHPSALITPAQLVEGILTEGAAFPKKLVAAPPLGYPILLSPRAAAIFAHEVYGHGSEGDIWFMKHGNLELGSTVGPTTLTVADIPGPLGSNGFCPVDNEGTPGKENLLVSHGMQTGFCLTRKTAAAIGLPPSGNARASSHEHKAIMRQRKLVVYPGTTSPEVFKAVSALIVDHVSHATLEGSTLRLSGCRLLVRDTSEGLLIQTGLELDVETLAAAGMEIGTETITFDGSWEGCGKAGQTDLPIALEAPYIMLHGANWSLSPS